MKINVQEDIVLNVKLQSGVCLAYVYSLNAFG